jgi:hypothetical protein
MYIYKSVAISPQHTFPGIDLDNLISSDANRLAAIEPKYENIPTHILRRMSKAIRMAVGSTLVLKEEFDGLDGIIIGTGTGGMDDCIRFLNQVIQYDEGTLTPTAFVQSTSNAIAAQIGLATKNHGYNITHVHRGLAFENALLDCVMLAKETPSKTYLLGGADEISNFNYNIEKLDGRYKEEIISSRDLYDSLTSGSIAGEGVAMFLVGDKKDGALANVKALKMLHTDDAESVKSELDSFLNTNLQDNQKVDLFLSGENGDSRHLHFYHACETVLERNTSVARFKHLCGEYPTAGSFALWLACFILQSQQVPQHTIKKSNGSKPVNTILIYNNFKGSQHSFILLEK